MKAYYEWKCINCGKIVSTLSYPSECFFCETNIFEGFKQITLENLYTHVFANEQHIMRLVGSLQQTIKNLIQDIA